MYPSLSTSSLWILLQMWLFHINDLMGVKHRIIRHSISSFTLLVQEYMWIPWLLPQSLSYNYVVLACYMLSHCHNFTLWLLYVSLAHYIRYNCHLSYDYDVLTILASCLEYCGWALQLSHCTPYDYYTLSILSK